MSYDGTPLFFLFYYFLSNIVTLSQHHAAKITPALPHCLLMFIEILKVLIPYCHFLGFAEVYLKKNNKKKQAVTVNYN